MEIKIEQGTKDWLELRRKHVTASEVPIIMGKSPYMTALKLYNQKISGEENSEPFKEYIFTKGHEAEKVARDFIEAQTGVKFSPVVIISDVYPFLMASLDGKNGEDIFESKLVSSKVMESLMNMDPIPEHHLIQIQAQLLVSNADKCLYFASTQDGKAHSRWIDRDDQWMDLIVEESKKFFDKLTNQEAPEVSSSDFVEVEDGDFKMIQDLRNQKAWIDEELKAIEERVKKKYKQAKVKCGNVEMVRSTCKGNVDYSKIEALNGLDLDKFRKPDFEKITFRINKEK